VGRGRRGHTRNCKDLGTSTSVGMPSTSVGVQENLHAVNLGPHAFEGVLHAIVHEQRELNSVNVSAILHHAAKNKWRLWRRVLNHITQTLHYHGEAFGAQVVGNALYGLQSLTDSAEVRSLLAALAPKVQQRREELSAQQVGNALYGLQSLSDGTKAYDEAPGRKPIYGGTLLLHLKA
jgi:hypothetical protein